MPPKEKPPTFGWTVKGIVFYCYCITFLLFLIFSRQNILVIFFFPQLVTDPPTQPTFGSFSLNEIHKVG